MRKLPDNVSSGEREQTKRIVYSVMYGAGTVLENVLCFNIVHIVLCSNIEDALKLIMLNFKIIKISLGTTCINFDINMIITGSSMSSNIHTGKEKLAEYLKIPPVEAKNIIDSFLGMHGFKLLHSACTFCNIC